MRLLDYAKLHALRNTNLFWKVYYFFLYQIFRNSNHLFSISDRNNQALHQFGDRSIRLTSMISPLPLPETRINLLTLTGRGIAGNTLYDMYNLGNAVLSTMFRKSFLHHVDNYGFLGTCQWHNG